MSVLSRIYSKLIFKNFKILKKINIYYRDFGSKSNFAIYIKDMSINFNYKFSKYSYQPHNPHIGAEGCIRWICESYHAVFDHLEKRPAKSLLEIGCGFGTSTWIMKDAVDGKTVGLDISKEAITSAKKLFPGVKYICQNYKEYFKKNPSTFFDVIVICNGPFKIRRKFMNVQHQNMKKLLLKHCNRYIQVGYRARNIKQFLFWEHKAEGKQLSFSTTLVENSKQGIYKKYFKYFFTWHYLQCLLHSIIHRFYIPL